MVGGGGDWALGTGAAQEKSKAEREVGEEIEAERSRGTDRPR